MNVPSKDDDKNNRWAERLVCAAKELGIEIPTLKGLFKNEPRTSVHFVIPDTYAVRAQMVKDAAPKRFRYLAELYRAALCLGLAVFEKMYRDDLGQGKKQLGTRRTICDLDEEALCKKQVLDDTTMAFHRAQNLKNDGIYSPEEYHQRIQDLLDDIQDSKLKVIAHNKYKKLIAGEKVVDLLELEYVPDKKTSGDGR